MPVLTPADFVVETFPTVASEQPNRTLWISEPGALTQFGAFIEELQPGARSSLRHWHRDEDELVYLLEGELVVLEGEGEGEGAAVDETVLRAGSAATFPAGVPRGHCLHNRGAQVARYLVVGTRAAADRITYPDHDRVLERDRVQARSSWTTLAGQPSHSPYDDEAL